MFYRRLGRDGRPLIRQLLALATIKPRFPELLKESRLVCYQYNFIVLDEYQ